MRGRSRLLDRRVEHETLGWELIFLLVAIVFLAALCSLFWVMLP